MKKNNIDIFCTTRCQFIISFAGLIIGKIEQKKYLTSLKIPQNKMQYLPHYKQSNES